MNKTANHLINLLLSSYTKEELDDFILKQEHEIEQAKSLIAKANHHKIGKRYKKREVNND